MSRSFGSAPVRRETINTLPPEGPFGITLNVEIRLQDGLDDCMSSGSLEDLIGRVSWLDSTHLRLSTVRTLEAYINSYVYRYNVLPFESGGSISITTA